MHGTETKADPKADSTLDDTPGGQWYIRVISDRDLDALALSLAGSLQDAANPVLPNEVRVEILDKLSGAELRQLSSVCLHFTKLMRLSLTNL